MQVRKWQIGGCFLAVLGLAQASERTPNSKTPDLRSPSGYSLKISWQDGPRTRFLSLVGEKDLEEVRTKRLQEVDPRDGQRHRWKGYRFSEVIEPALKSLTLHQRANVDLLLLKSGSGKEVVVPRSFVTKYPVLLARDHRDGTRLFSLVPWSHDQRIRKEVLPLSQYFVEDVTEVVLTNYRMHFGKKVFAKKRTDPTVIRGEKRYMQTCLGCHTQKTLPGFGDLAERMGTQVQLSQSHGEVGSMPPFSDFDVRSLKNYFEAMLSPEVARNQ